LTLSPFRRLTAWSHRAGFALSLGVAAVTLAACGGGGNVPPPVATVQAPPPTAPAPAAPPTSPGAALRIALLLPLSGNNAALGQGMLQAAQMALFDVGGNDVALIVRDTEATGGAGAAARSALNEGAQIILGPIYASATKEVAPIAQSTGINVISFSTDREAAGNGAFIMGVLPQIQVDRVVGYASSQGIHRYAALAPSSPYGHQLADALAVAAGRFGGQFVDAQFYEAGARNPTDSVKALAKTVGAQGDAVMLPEGGAVLRSIAPLLTYYEVDTTKVRLLGSRLWADDPTLGNEAVLDGGWYAAPPTDSWAKFAQSYRAAYDVDPPRIASLAYDATTLALGLAKEAPNNFTVASITRPNGFNGVDGIFRFTPNGLVERGLAVYEVEKDGPRLIDPAPKDFQALTQ
jgi:ABC-type branched-subunit amino acid transport system substrate-binding protein